jgi:hypothetical protein
VALRCRGCNDTYVGTTLKGIVDKAPKGQLPLGFCSSCNEQLDSDMKEFSKTYAGRAPEPKGPLSTAYETTDPEPDRELSVAIDEQEELDINDFDVSGEEDDERDEYWR